MAIVCESEPRSFVPFMRNFLVVALSTVSLAATSCEGAPKAERPMLLITPSTSDIPEGLTAGSLRDKLAEAAALWSFPQIPCTSLRIQVGQSKPLRRAAQDGTNAIVFRRSRWCHNERCGHTSTFPPGAAAMTMTYPSPPKPGHVLEADVELNGVGFSWGEGNISKPQAPLGAVLLHEVGHMLGFPDTCADECSGDEALSVMKSGSTNIELTAWDVARVCAVFPK